MNGFSDVIGKWFSRLVTKVVILHQSCIRCDMAAGVRRASLSCWRATVGNIHEQYIHKDTLPLSLLRDGLEKLRYDAVVSQVKTG